MRTGPVALAAIGDRDEVARLASAVAELTHPHADSVDACVLWSLAIERAITTASPDAGFDWIGALLGGLEHVAAGRRTLWCRRIEGADGADPSTFSVENGWVVGAFQAAIAALTSTADDEYRFPCDHLAASLRAAARAGGDTDTVAAIVGSLAGARWGASGIPLVWRRPLHGRITYARSPIGAARLDALARLALGGGRPDASGWPGVAHVDYGPMTPVYVELDRAWFGNVAGREAALRDGATIVVSLCRTGSGAVPAGVEHHTIGLIDSGADDNANGVFVLHDTARTVADLVDAGERVYVHCARAEHRAPSIAAAYLIARGAGASAAIERASRATGGAPSPYLRDQLRRVADAQQGPRLPR